MKDTSGPAFPVPVNETMQVDEGYETYPSGMTLRDWFAGQALVGQCSKTANFRDGLIIWEMMAEDSYKAADAMLAEKNKP